MGLPRRCFAFELPQNKVADCKPINGHCVLHALQRTLMKDARLGLHSLLWHSNNQFLDF